jgi:hypothetical protein
MTTAMYDDSNVRQNTTINQDYNKYKGDDDDDDDDGCGNGGGGIK